MAEHSVFQGATPPWTVTSNNDLGSYGWAGTNFYVEPAPDPAWRLLGGRIYVPAGSAAIGRTARMGYFLQPSGQAAITSSVNTANDIVQAWIDVDAGANASSVVLAEGWNTAYLPTPVNLSTYSAYATVAIGFTVPLAAGEATGTHYFSVAGGTVGPGAVVSPDGITTLQAYNDPVQRGVFGQGNGSGGVASSGWAFLGAWYGVDVIYDDETPSTPLDTPATTVTNESDPTSPGGSDGFITVTWTPVSNADHYEAGIADGHDQTTGFTTVSSSATSPFDFTGLGAGDYTVAIRAMPAE